MLDILEFNEILTLNLSYIRKVTKKVEDPSAILYFRYLLITSLSLKIVQQRTFYVVFLITLQNAWYVVI